MAPDTHLAGRESPQGLDPKRVEQEIEAGSSGSAVSMTGRRRHQQARGGVGGVGAAMA